MKFTTTSVIAIGLSAQALANPSYVDRRASKVQRDVAAFESVVSAVDTAVKKFDSDINSYSSGDVSSLLSDSSNIITVTNSGVSSLQGESTLSTTDAVTLSTAVQGLSSDVQTAINDLISKKAALVAAGAGGQVETGLQNQLTAAQSLATLISNKVPSSLAGVASELSSGITDAIQSGIAAFSGTGSTSTAASSGTGSTAAATTTGAATSTGAATTATATATSAGATTVATSASSKTTGAATSSGSLPGSSQTSTGVVPHYTGAASANKASGAVGLVAALLAVFAL